MYLLMLFDYKTVDAPGVRHCVTLNCLYSVWVVSPRFTTTVSSSYVLTHVV